MQRLRRRERLLAHWRTDAAGPMTLAQRPDADPPRHIHGATLSSAERA